MADQVQFDVSERIATIMLNRPEKLNAVTPDMVRELLVALDEAQERDDILVVILTGAGRAFCSGGDVGGMGAERDNRPHIAKELIWNGVQAFPKRLAQFDKPIIAAVNGPAVGMGMDLALACDFRTAGTSARFAETYAKIGLAPGGGGAYFLPRLVGKAMALEMLLTAQFIDAEEALRIGLVNHVYDDDTLMAETHSIASEIAKLPPLSIKLIKRAVEQGLNADMNTAFDLISSHIAILRAGHDHPEAIRAFREKRDGDYKGY